MINGKQVATVGKGVGGRSVVAEVVRPDATLFRLLVGQGKEAAKAYWLSEMGALPAVLTCCTSSMRDRLIHWMRIWLCLWMRTR